MIKILVCWIAMLALYSSSIQARDYISIAGSSTVLPFSTIISEKMGRNPDFNTPVVESGGSSVGKKRVCEGTGLTFTDIGNASSRMKVGELKYCNDMGVVLTEIKVGYDGIVLANSRKGPMISITRSDLAKALSAKVPSEDGSKLIDNPYKLWSDVNPTLPNIAIKVMGPPTTSGTRASFVEMVNEKGYCKKDPVMKPLLKKLGKSTKSCKALRTDGAYIEAGEQDNLIVQNLQNDPAIFGIFGFSYLDQNTDTIQGALIDGIEPTFENIADGKYTVSRALYFYIKHNHIGVIPGLKEYTLEWTKHWDEDGVLAESGMIPMPEEEREYYKDAMKNLPVLTDDMLK
tara:strand:- start:231 stop:1265 length:1035 start_codon:yes stop_codon:yes gene_type:complete